MLKKILIGIAFAGMVGGFALAIRDLYRFASWYCGEAEGGANCRAFVELAATSHIWIFATCAVGLAVLLLLPHSRSTDK